MDTIVNKVEAILHILDFQSISIQPEDLHHLVVSSSGRSSSGGSYSGGGKLSRKKENQWDPVTKACKFEGDLEPKCIKAYYDHLDRNNHLEWSIWLEEFMYS